MKSTVDLQGLTPELAQQALHQALNQAGVTTLEIQCSDEAVTQTILELLAKSEAECELLSAKESQVIIANLNHDGVMDSTSLVVGSDQMGQGDDVIGTKLMNAFFNVSGDYKQVPQSIFFLNTGVKLTVADSPALGGLQALQQKGCDIIVCGTCLDYFSLTEKLAVGRVGTMHDLIGIYHSQTKVIAL